MTRMICFLAIASLIASACTKDKTDYKAESGAIGTDQNEFKEALTFQDGLFTMRIETWNGKFYTGYNEVKLKISQGSTAVIPEESSILPLLTIGEKQKISAAHPDQFHYDSERKALLGYAVFTHEDNWELQIHYTIEGQARQFTQKITVLEQPNKNLNTTQFTGRDGQEYFIALIAPKKPSVAENALVAGIYRLDKLAESEVRYMEVNDHKLLLDPRMPEPSMGNHSSPNNKDLTQQDDGFYHGVVNYTMTGNWTLNFILLDSEGKVLKGTRVSEDFTPGVPGVKSELFIDILF